MDAPARTEAVLRRLDSETDAALERLFALLRIPSVSTDPAHAQDCLRAAEWLAGDLAGIGFEARVERTDGHPLVVAHDLSGPGPHLLFYGHYDVQPPDPLELWESPPFEPRIVTRADGSRMIVARGAADDKGQLMTFVEACRAFRAERGALPCKISIVLEGEEETTGAALERFLQMNADELRADLALVCDTGMWNAETPAITTMLRGIVKEEVRVRGPSRDLHSGFYGGAAANPIHMLTRALGDLHDDRGRVTLEGFYDGVPDLPPAIREQWEALDFDTEAFLGEVGLRLPAGEADHGALEQVWSRPTAEINGIVGGYTGEGFKTVIPAEASAKVSFRLVGGQDPGAIRESFRAFMREEIRADCSIDFADQGGAPAIVMPTEAQAFETARRALSEEWGKEAAFIGCGGSIPVVGSFKRRLGLDSLLIGFGLEDDRLHSPNEKYDLASFTKGARSWVRVLDALAAD